MMPYLLPFWWDEGYAVVCLAKGKAAQMIASGQKHAMPSIDPKTNAHAMRLNYTHYHLPVIGRLKFDPMAGYIGMN